MSSNIDLKQLAIDRGAPSPATRSRGHWLMRYVIPITLIAGFVGVVTWAGWDVMFPPREVTVTPVSVRTSAALPGTRLFEASGWIEPRPTPIHVAALAPGVVDKLLVVDDQLVRAGEPIAELIKDDARLTLDAMLAEKKLRESERDDAKAAHAAALQRMQYPLHLEVPLRQAEADLAKISTELANLPFRIRAAEADRGFAQGNYDGKVAAQGAVAGRAIQLAKAELDAAEALVDELNLRVKSLEAEQAALAKRRDALERQLELLIDETEDRDQAAAMVSATEARVNRACVAVDEAQLQLDRMTILAPIDGRIYHLVGHPGVRVGGSQFMGEFDSSTVVTMYIPSQLQARVDVRFEDVPKVHLGQEVRINNASIEQPLTGRVLYVSSEADIQKNTLEVKVEINNAPDFFKPEMLVDATFLAPETSGSQSESEKEHIFAPRNLVHGAEDAAYVWLVDQSEGRVYKTPVTLGAESGDLVEIKSGLTRTSRLVTGEAAGLSDGGRVRVTGEDLTASTR